LPRARILRSAVKDLDEIWLYIARDSVDAAEKMIQRIEEASEKLASMPGMGQKRDDLQPGIRSYPVSRYLIFYRAIRGGIEVLHVYHGARKYQDLFRSDEDD
jgi:toxin ParE1/3/4